jgi:cysteine desulfurase
MASIYLDNNATTAVDPAVVEALLPFLAEHYGNPSSTHQAGNAAARAVRAARKEVQALLGAAHDSEIAFTSGGTESNATAIFSALKTQKGKRTILTTAVEHPAILSVCEALEKDGGITIEKLPVNGQGELDLAHCEARIEALKGELALVTVMWANNETGTVFPVEAIAKMAAGRGILFHTDAVQAVGKLPMRLAGSAIDFLSFSGHKLFAPKGIGVLYIKRGTPFAPLFLGGAQERSRRAGTENVPGIVGLGKAASLALGHLPDEAETARLRDKLEAGLLARIPRSAALGSRRCRVPNTTQVAFEDIEGEALSGLLSREGLMVSSSSACAAGSLAPSHVLQAMKVPYALANGALRFSLSRKTTEAEIDRALEILPPAVERLRALLPDAGNQSNGV